MHDLTPQPDISERIRLAYDPQMLACLIGELTQLLPAHLRDVQAGNAHVLNWADPVSNTQRARASLREDLHSQDPEQIRRDFRVLVQRMLDHGQNLHHPRYLGHQVPASVPIAALFDAVGSITNQVMAIYEMGPWATSVERAMVEELGRCIGWQAGSFDGFVTHGGSLANLTALLTARNVALENVWEHGLTGFQQPPVIVIHAEAHYAVTRAAAILGIGRQHMIKAALDDKRRIDPQQLDITLTDLKRAGHPIVAVSANACATPIGAFDPLEEIADVCQKHEVWLHVDAAHGGAALLSSRYRHLVAGIERADSLVWDAHKMLFMPALCAFVFYRAREHRFEAFRQDAPYLFDPAAPGLAEYDSGMKTVECTKRAAAFGLWGCWSLFGRQLFEDLVDQTFDQCRLLFQKLESAPDFAPLHEPECNILAFRYLPSELDTASAEEIGRFQLEVRRRIMISGEFYIVQTQAEGHGALRVTIINPLTSEEHLDQLMLTVRRYGQQLLSEPNSTTHTQNSDGQPLPS